MASAGDDGVLYISFGTFKQFNQQIVDRVGAAIAALPYKVIWKSNMKINANLDPERVMILEWAPQNDILAHPSTRAFLTHGGTYNLCCDGVSVDVYLLACRHERDSGGGVPRSAYCGTSSLCRPGER